MPHGPVFLDGGLATPQVELEIDMIFEALEALRTRLEEDAVITRKIADTICGVEPDSPSEDREIRQESNGALERVYTIINQINGAVYSAEIQRDRIARAFKVI